MVSFRSWLDKVSFSALTGSVGFLVLWLSWLSYRTLQCPTTNQTVEMIQTHAPYNLDKRAINEALTRSTESTAKLEKALDNNTKAIIRLEAVMQSFDRKK